jgi:tetratricopeptide (TPR) repeat protein
MAGTALSSARNVVRVNRIKLWIAGFLIAAASGCQSVSNQGASNSFVSATSAPTPENVKERELPAAESAKLCFATAEKLEQGGKFAEAISLYEKARKEDSRIGVQATRRLAALHDRTGNFDKALEEYNRGLRDNPRDAELLNNLGYGYYCRGQWTAAEKQLRLAVSVDVKMTSAWNNLGMALAQQGRYDESLTAFEKAVSKAQARCNLAYIQATQMKNDEARQNYERALQLEPGLQIARIALQKLGQPRPAGTMAANAAPQGILEK